MYWCAASIYVKCFNVPPLLIDGPNYGRCAAGLAFCIVATVS
jgi:hypothetical protein